MFYHDQPIDNFYIFKSDVYSDRRGSFYRSFCSKLINSNITSSFNPVQGNISINPLKGTLRGMHTQLYPSNESKLITCVSGSVFLVVIDLRVHSPTFLNKKSLILEHLTGKSLHIPESCLTGWLTLSDHTCLHYYMGDNYAPELSFGVRYDDPFFSIRWPSSPHIISEKDMSYSNFDIDQYKKLKL